MNLRMRNLFFLIFFCLQLLSVPTYVRTSSQAAVSVSKLNDILSVNTNSTNVNRISVSHNDTSSSNRVIKKPFTFDIFDKIIRSLLVNIIINEDALGIISKFISYIMWFYLLLSGAGSLGFDTKPFINLFSIIGITLGLAVKDIIAELFLGIVIIFTAPFKRGFTIDIDGKKGRVTEIDARYVHLLNNGHEILIPHKKVSQCTIVIEKRS